MHQTALQIAMDSGSALAEVFSRAFRAYRRCGWRDWATHHQTELRKIHQAQHKTSRDIAKALLKERALWPARPVTCAVWLPQSGYQPDNNPALELYEGDFVVDPNTGAFSCWLCVPVRPH